MKCVGGGENSYLVRKNQYLNQVVQKKKKTILTNVIKKKIFFSFCLLFSVIKNMVEEVKDTVFVGGIPYDMTLEEFEEEVAIWGPVTKKYLKFHGGWGTVTFESNSSRNRFLKDKTKHKVGSKLVDVKPYIYNPEKVKVT